MAATATRTDTGTDTHNVVRTVERRLLPGCVVALLVLAAAAGMGGRSWRWTGFQDNRQLWDWLHLLLLPFVLERLPRPTGAALATLCCAGLAFALVVVAGYLVPWRWTGFTGNTLLDWVSLLIVPFALPVTIAVVLATAEHAEHDDGAEVAEDDAAATA